jgi:lysophospholipase L1-like esterase
MTNNILKKNKYIMAGYEDTRQKIISTLMGRPVGTEIQPENHQDYALNMLDYIRSLELIATSTLIGVAESNTTPVQPNSSRVCYIAGVAQNQTVVFENFIDENGNPISITTGDMEGVFIILLWNTQYWSAQIFSTNIISQSESSTFYYNYNIKKTYSSFSAMNADKENPIGTDGKYIKVGDIVTVVNSTTPSENGIYSYEGSENGWKYQSSFNFQVETVRSQNNNTSPSSKLFDDELNKNECYNVTNRIPLSAGQYYDLTSAIAAVPVANRKLGLKLTYMSALYEKDTLTVTTAPTTSENIIITLNGVEVTIALDSTMDTTPTLVATKIKSATFTGWTISGTGATVIFTKNTVGACSAPIFNAGTTGSAANFVRTVVGAAESIIETQFNGSSIASWTTKANWRCTANEVDIANLRVNFNQNIIGNTLFDKVGYISFSNGILINSDFWRATDYIPVEEGDTVRIKASVGASAATLACYSSNKSYLKDKSIEIATSMEIDNTYTIPAGVTYIRTCSLKSYPASITVILVNSLRKNILDLQAEVSSVTAEQINGDFTIISSETLTGYSYSTGGYKNQVSDTQIAISTHATIHSAIITGVTEGDVLLVSMGQIIDPNGSLGKAYYIFGKTETVPAIKISEIGNYVQLYDEANKIYKVTIPKDCTIFYLTMADSVQGTSFIKNCVTKKTLNWLEVAEENLDPTIITEIENTVSTNVQNNIETGQLDYSSNYHLWDSINKPIDFSGKKLIAFGDSITSGVSSPGLVTLGATKYISLFCSHVGAILTNEAISGSTITDNGNQYAMCKRVVQYATSAYDIIYIAGGTNDYNQNMPIGTYASTDQTTLYGALRTICEHLKTNCPNAVVIFVTPIPYTSVARRTKSEIQKLDTVRSAIYDIATLYGYNVVDGKNLGMPKTSGNWNHAMVDDSDGCHPTELGHSLYAKCLAGKLL